MAAVAIPRRAGFTTLPLSFATMPGRRPLTSFEQQSLRAVLTLMPPRDHALVAVQWCTGARIREVLHLRVRDVWREGAVVPLIGFAPGIQKGKRGRTRYTPVPPDSELRRGLERYFADILASGRFPAPDDPLFVSREHGPTGELRAISPETARVHIAEVFQRAGVLDDGRLGSHSLRKTWARSCYEASGRDIMVLKSALSHSSVMTTQKYLEADASEIERAMAAAANPGAPSAPGAAAQSAA